MVGEAAEDFGSSEVNDVDTGDRDWRMRKVELPMIDAGVSTVPDR